MEPRQLWLCLLREEGTLLGPQPVVLVVLVRCHLLSLLQVQHQDHRRALVLLLLALELLLELVEEQEQVPFRCLLLLLDLRPVLALLRFQEVLELHLAWELPLVLSLEEEVRFHLLLLRDQLLVLEAQQQMVSQLLQAWELLQAQVQLPPSHSPSPSQHLQH